MGLVKCYRQFDRNEADFAYRKAIAALFAALLPQRPAIVPGEEVGWTVTDNVILAKLTSWNRHSKFLSSSSSLKGATMR